MTSETAASAANAIAALSAAGLLAVLAWPALPLAAAEWFFWSCMAALVVSVSIHGRAVSP